MRVLVLGGTVFLGREVASAALRAGHEVTCAARGVSGQPPEDAEFVVLDRDSGLEPLAGRRFDVVVDTTSDPGRARDAVTTLRATSEQWVFVSTGNVYADELTPGQRADSAPLVAPGDDDYGNRKVACEQIVRAAGPALIARAGLIVGPAEVAPRFPYWPVRLSRGGEVVVPGTADRLVQYIDVADLADWLLAAGTTGVTGDFDAVGPPRPFGELLRAIAPDAQLTWVDEQFLLDHEVEPWSGENSLPLWLPTAQYGGFLCRDTSPAAAAGLAQRPVEQTAARIMDWWDGQPLAAGLSPEREAAVLAAWHAR